MTKVLILMATHNGARFIAEQLESIATQDHADWELVVSDDASCDDTAGIVRSFAVRFPDGQVRLVDGPRKGATENFRHLLRQADILDRSLAFSDQDDVWDKDHLSRGLAALSSAPTPLAIYGSRMRVCDAKLGVMHLSPLPSRPLGFRNALVQNMLSGNTMLMTPQAALLLQQAEAEIGPVPVHDWWAYQLVTGAGGTAIYDERPGIFYRQHGSNVIGLKRGLRSLPARLQRHLGGAHHEWAAMNCAALAASRARLTPENRQRLDHFARALDQRLPGRIISLRKSGVYHQSRAARMAFWASVVLGRF